jgi:hypothetical protein
MNDHVYCIICKSVIAIGQNKKVLVTIKSCYCIKAYFIIKFIAVLHALSLVSSSTTM